MFYIYQHIRNDNGQIFYVGKGQGDRAKSKERNPFWKNVFKKAGGFTIDYFKTDIKDESEAYEIEKSRIAELRNQGVELTNISEGGEGFGSGESHPGYGKDRSDYELAKMRLGHLEKSNVTSVTKRTVKRNLLSKGRTYFIARGCKTLEGKTRDIGEFPMKHEAIKSVIDQKERVTTALTRYVFEVDNNLDISKTYKEIIKEIIPSCKSGFSIVGTKKKQRSKLKSAIEINLNKGNIEKARLQEDTLLEIEEQILELNPNTQSCRTYEEELALQHLLADKYLQQGNNQLHKKTLDTIAALKKEQSECKPKEVSPMEKRRAIEKRRAERIAWHKAREEQSLKKVA